MVLFFFDELIDFLEDFIKGCKFSVLCEVIGKLVYSYVKLYGVYVGV